MFECFPAAKNTSAGQVKQYAEDLQGYPASVVERCVEGIKRGTIAIENPDFPPSLPRLLAAIKAIAMTPQERTEMFRLQGKPEPIGYMPPKETTSLQPMSAEDRAGCVERLKREFPSVFKGADEEQRISTERLEFRRSLFDRGNQLPGRRAGNMTESERNENAA